jgi:hypothetical protein
MVFYFLFQFNRVQTSRLSTYSEYYIKYIIQFNSIAKKRKNEKKNCGRGGRGGTFSSAGAIEGRQNYTTIE